MIFSRYPFCGQFFHTLRQIYIYIYKINIIYIYIKYKNIYEYRNTGSTQNAHLR